MNHTDRVLIACGLSTGDSLIRKRVSEILTDVRVVERNLQHRKLGSRILRTAKAWLLTGGVLSDEPATPWPKDAVLEVLVKSDHAGDVELNRIRVRPTSYGVEISADSPVIPRQSASNRVEIVGIGFSEFADILGADQPEGDDGA